MVQNENPKFENRGVLLLENRGGKSPLRKSRCAAGENPKVGSELYGQRNYQPEPRHRILVCFRHSSIRSSAMHKPGKPSIVDSCGLVKPAETCQTCHTYPKSFSLLSSGSRSSNRSSTLAAFPAFTATTGTTQMDHVYQIQQTTTDPTNINRVCSLTQTLVITHTRLGEYSLVFYHLRLLIIVKI